MKHWNKNKAYRNTWVHFELAPCGEYQFRDIKRELQNTPGKRFFATLGVSIYSFAAFPSLRADFYFEDAGDALYFKLKYL